jgi:phasin family protein
MADTRKRPRAAPAKPRSRAGDDNPAEPEGHELPGADPPLEAEAEAGNEAEAQDVAPAASEAQDEKHTTATTATTTTTTTTTTEQDATMEAHTTVQSAQQTYDKILGSSREHVEKANQAMIKTAEEMQKLSKENLEACIQASTIIAKGMQELGREWTAYVQESMERSAAAAKAMMSARSLQEVINLQSDWLKASLDKLVAETTKLSERTVKVTNEAMEPISARLSVAADKLNERWRMQAAA